MNAPDTRRHPEPQRRAPRTQRSLTALALMLGLGTAWAQSSPWYFGGSAGVTRESNSLRVEEGALLPDGLAKADTVTSTALLAGLDQPLGRQRLSANVALRENRYDSNPRFNNQGWSIATGLDWSTINRIAGNVSFNSNRGLQRFNTDEVGVLTQKNLESSHVLSASLGIGLVTEYSLEFSAAQRRVRNSLETAVVDSREFDQNNVLAGLRWRPRAGTSVRVALGAAEGRYPRYIRNPDGSFRPDRFKRSDVEVSASLDPGGASTFDARIATGRTRYDLNDQRDFDGVTGSLGWNWRPTGKLRVNTQLSRDTGTDSYRAQFNVQSNTDYSRLLTSLRVNGTWEATAKISLSAGLTYIDRELVNTVTGTLIPLDARGQDRTTIVTFGARWAPLRGLLVGCDASQDSRKSDGVLSRNLDGRSLGCFGQWVLQ